jgi:hypothetical protein
MPGRLVRVDQHVDHSLTESLMNRCIVLPDVTFQHKRHFQVSNELA